MYPTTEVRWFLAGTSPAHVDAWFRRVGRDPAHDSRIDHYLRLPGVDGVGVKWREERLEVKRRVTAGEAVAFTSECTGAVARWRKWSFGLAETDVLTRLRAADDWIAVAKDRRLHAYAVDAERGVRNVPPGITPWSGCELELGTVQAAGQTWWTVAFEAFGEEEAQSTALQRTVEHVLAAEGTLALPATASASYPRWLAFFLTNES